MHVLASIGGVKTEIHLEPESVTGDIKLTERVAEILDKKSYAERWSFSVRTIDNFLRAGMPHLRVGERRVRIIVAEADAWMRQRFGTQRRGALLRQRVDHN